MPPASEIIAVGIAAGLCLCAIGSVVYARTAHLYGQRAGRLALAEFVGLTAVAGGAAFTAGWLVEFNAYLFWVWMKHGHVGAGRLVGAAALLGIAAACTYRLLRRVNRLVAEKTNDT